MTLGTKLRNLRTDKGISMEEFAIQIDISKTAVVNGKQTKPNQVWITLSKYAIFTVSTSMNS